MNVCQPVQGYGTTLNAGCGRPSVCVVFTQMDLKFFPVPEDCADGFGYQPRIAADYNHRIAIDRHLVGPLTRGKERGNVYLRLLRNQ